MSERTIRKTFLLSKGVGRIIRMGREFIAWEVT